MLLRRTSRVRRSERGYVMMLLLLTLALMAIAAGVIASSISFDIKRDREEEMIHRGVQYSRAIRAYYKKFGRYPAKIEDLEDTSKLRFLRKRYKDPLACKEGKCADFKLLHYGEAKLSMGMGANMIPGASALGANGALTSNSGLTQTTSFGANGGFGANSNSFGQNGFGQNSSFGQNAQPNNAPAQPTDATTGEVGDASQQPPPGTPSGPGGSTSPFGGLNSGTGDKLSNTTFGGAPIVGVASTSKEKTIREFDHKKKYNEWQFVYDPTLDRGTLITTPYQPQLQQFGMQGIQNVNGQNGSGQNGSNGLNNSFGNSFGNNSGNGFGNSFGNNPGGMQNNNPSSPNSGGFGNPPPQPPQPPPQQ